MKLAHDEYCNCDQSLHYYKILKAIVDGTAGKDADSARRLQIGLEEARVAVSGMADFDDACACENGDCPYEECPHE